MMNTRRKDSVKERKKDLFIKRKDLSKVQNSTLRCKHGQYRAFISIHEEVLRKEEKKKKDVATPISTKHDTVPLPMLLQYTLSLSLIHSFLSLSLSLSVSGQ